MKDVKKPIYTVTTLRAAAAAMSRCVGFYYTYEEAKEAIELNDCDISEQGYYHFAVIEKKFVGVYNFNSLNIWWFRWHGDKKYHPCEVPKNYQRTIAFSMG